MKNKYESPVPIILEKCCHALMIVIIITASLLWSLLHIIKAFNYPFDISSKGLKDYISLYGEYGIPQLIGIFFVTLTAQIYLEQLKVSKIGFVTAENLSTRTSWDQKVDNWLLSSSGLDDGMRNVLKLSKGNVYNVLLKYDFNISNEEILIEILKQYSFHNFRLFEELNPTFQRNSSKYFFKNQWYSLDNFYMFICIISDSQYNGAYEKCLNYYAINLPRETFRIGNSIYEM